jgi:hypothetical protein
LKKCGANLKNFFAAKRLYPCPTLIEAIKDFGDRPNCMSVYAGT